MSTTRAFNAMLNQYLPNDLLMEEMIKRDFFLTNITQDENWKGGDLIVPHRKQRATSVEWGQLPAANDISQHKYLRGSITEYREVWGSLIFNETDLQQHDGKITETTFLRILPDQLEDFMDYFKEVVSIQLGNGPHFATVTDATNAATGVMLVNKIDRFELDQKVVLDDSNSSPGTYYVTDINLNTSAVTLSATRGGSAADVSAYSVAQSAKFYHPGVWDGSTSSAFQSIRDSLLSASNGGSTTLHGLTKTASPYLQALNISGADITASNILDKLFLAYVSVRQKARGRANKFVMSFKHWGSCMMALQLEKGAYSVVNNAGRSEYGWHEVTIASTTNGEQLTIVGVQEMEDDVIFVLDMKSMTFRSNGGFKKRVDPDGNLFYVQRATSGYQYIVDLCLFGELELTRPTNNAIIYGITDYAADS